MPKAAGTAALRDRGHPVRFGLENGASREGGHGTGQVTCCAVSGAGRPRAQSAHATAAPPATSDFSTPSGEGSSAQGKKKQGGRFGHGDAKRIGSAQRGDVSGAQHAVGEINAVH
jgi:hypothetical protein